ncbi:MAG: methylaspartate mutase accessory protein GlmL [Gammaproteobacteria bacterium]|nr:MAG: methylaspartate mutase accessory protein GlmL [Gammaproteobacteria bacterium]
MTALLIDFGSTYTKLRAVSLDPPRVLASGQGPSTVSTDITIGMHAALADLERRLGALPEFEHRLACSSAAGGLRMLTIGLVRELTVEAARQAALGAGARLVGTFAQRLTRDDAARIQALAPDIVLLAGGTDGGNADVILHNAATLAGTSIDCPIVVAGNRAAADDIRDRLAAGGKSALVTENVMPEFGKLNIEPARAVIRKVFIDRIVHSKGIDRAADLFDQVLMPTPAAVMEGARLLAEGCDGVEGIGPLLLVDVGGATTDVHSIASGEPSESGVVTRGLPEPYVKRTVEGDLGMRHNVLAVVEEAGLDVLAADSGLTASQVRELVAVLADDVARLPASPRERALDSALARAAVRVAVKRHAGTIETVHTVNGPVSVQRGKDLSKITMMIGTGGALAHNDRPAFILEGGLADRADPLSLGPRNPRLMIDDGYLLYAIGLVGAVAPAAAIRLAQAQLKTVEADNCDAGIRGASR